MEICQCGSDIIKFRRELSGNTMKAVLEEGRNSHVCKVVRV